MISSSNMLIGVLAVANFISRNAISAILVTTQYIKVHA